MSRWRSARAQARLAITARVIAGTLGAYGVTVLGAIALSLLLALAGMDRAQAVIASALASFAIFVAISVAVFHARSATRAWIALMVTAVPLALVDFFLSPVAG